MQLFHIMPDSAHTKPLRSAFILLGQFKFVAEVLTDSNFFLFIVWLHYASYLCELIIRLHPYGYGLADKWL